MIQFFIKIANNWVGKVIFGALLFGMVFVLGYGGLSNTSRYPDNAIVVGRQALSMKQLDDLFKQRLQQLSHLGSGQYVSPKKAVESGLLDVLVREQAQEMLLNAIKRELGLTASNAAVQKYVEHNPIFADVTGNFDRNLFKAYLQRMNMSERALGEKLQQELATQHLTNSVRALAYAPKYLVETVYRAQNEQRDVTAVVIEADKIKPERTPTEQELQDYYDIYAADKFVTPEYRTFSYLNLTPDMMLDRVQVSDDEVDMVFDEQKSLFETPEKRLVRQMYFKDEAAARDMMNGLTTGNFEQKARELGQSEADTDFGYVTRNELMEELAEPVFQSSANAIVGPVESMTGWHILWVKEIQTAKLPSEAEIRANIKQQLAQEQTYEVRENLVRQLEDLLGEGKSLTTAAQELNLSLKTATTDVAGQQTNGQMLTGDIANRDLLQNLFILKEGDTSATFESGNSILIAEVTDITPVGTKSFNQVRSELKTLWENARREEKLTQIADQIMAQVQEGKPLSTQKCSDVCRLVRKKDLSIAATDAVFSSSALGQIFKQPVGPEGTVRIDLPNGVMIAMTNQVMTPVASEADITQTKENVSEMLGNSLVAGVADAYTDELGLVVNEGGIKQVFSVYTTDRE